MTSIFPQWIQDLNTGVSFIGFGITIYVLIEVRSIKNSFLRKARLPEVIRDLSKAGSALSSTLSGGVSQRNESHCQIKIAASLIKSTIRILPKEEKEEIVRVYSKLATAASDINYPRLSNEDALWDLYSDIQSAISSMKQLVKNLKWE
ncbi:hypothetical protein [Chromobacterium amazonense]|uniref:DUF4145 domain-containing protein n=1 Tax=Chromobacterium amazonense TaxID=1382803 RepID=A0ABU8V3E1_9NEIS|nr:hypothetical protein [Chromobacterium amazonense]MDQ4540747.1 hypothetical protein [Chromobacterium amazonense]